MGGNSLFTGSEIGVCDRKGEGNSGSWPGYVHSGACRERAQFYRYSAELQSMCVCAWARVWMHCREGRCGYEDGQYLNGRVLVR